MANMATIFSSSGDLGPYCPLILSQSYLCIAEVMRALSSESPVQVVSGLVTDILFEVVAGDDIVGIKKEPNGVSDYGTVGDQLWVILVKHPMNLVDVAAHHAAITPRFWRFSCRVCVVATTLVVASLMSILYVRDA